VVKAGLDAVCYVLLLSINLFSSLHLFIFFTGNNKDYPIPESLEKMDISIPVEGTLYDYTYNFKQKGNWKYWPDVLKAMHAIETVNIQQTLIPTTESVRLVSAIMECYVMTIMLFTEKNSYIIVCTYGVEKS
jgi:hypothetical protein